MRSYGFRLKDLSPFTERVFFPGFVSWFNRLDETSRSHINARLSDAIYNRADTDAGYPLALYLNGHAETSHSIGDAGSFPLMAYRADRIAWSVRQDRMHSLQAG